MQSSAMAMSCRCTVAVFASTRTRGGLPTLRCRSTPTALRTALGGPFRSIRCRAVEEAEAEALGSPDDTSLAPAPPAAVADQ